MRGLDLDERAGGVILHPTSLPGPYGIGDLGPWAHRWIDILADSATGLWQILPLGHTGYGDSPYACLSSFAGNVNLISPESLAAEGILDSLDPAPPSSGELVDFGAVIPAKRSLVAAAHRSFVNGKTPSALRDDYNTFRERNADWVEDYALFIVIKDHHDQQSWVAWPRELRLRDPAALRRARAELAREIDTIAFGQFLFFRQWEHVRVRAAQCGVRIIGDIPFFVAGDSADVWSRPELFELDSEGAPRLLTGVPPDYFSDDGQLWGNPQYRWSHHEAEGYAWWISRLEATLSLVDIVRIDHFRAFANYWEIPAGSATARTGVWRDGPGLAFFETVQASLGDLPIIAEDLGELSPKVPELLQEVGFPGMRVLQVAWDGGDDDPFLPHNYPMNTVVYSGTHDNDTTLGWWRTADAELKAQATHYMHLDPEDPVGGFLETLWGSRAMVTITPLQDLLRLGSEARMNIPGTTSGNWRWRAREDQFDDALVSQLKALNERYQRLAVSQR